MSAGEWLVASCMALLDQNAAVDPLRMFDFVPARAAYPYAIIEDPVLSAEDGHGVTGRVGTIGIVCRDGGERADRVRWLQDRVEAEMAMLGPDLGSEGWRLVGLRLTKSLIARGKDEWLTRSVWAVRIFRMH